eukprot:1202996-Rhodomonas_salina.2
MRSTVGACLLVPLSSAGVVVHRIRVDQTPPSPPMRPSVPLEATAYALILWYHRNPLLHVRTSV